MERPSRPYVKSVPRTIPVSSEVGFKHCSRRGVWESSRQNEGRQREWLLWGRAYLLRAPDGTLLEFKTQREGDPDLLLPVSSPVCGQYLSLTSLVSARDPWGPGKRQAGDTFLFPFECIFILLR